MQRANRQSTILAVADFLSAAAGFCIFNIVRFYTVPSYLRPDDLHDFLLWTPVLAEQILVPFLALAFFALFGSYNKANTLYKSRLDESLITVAVSICTMLAVFFVALINDPIEERSTTYELMLELVLSDRKSVV